MSRPGLALVPAIALLGAVAYVAYGGGFPNVDASWTLVWGREALELDVPSFADGSTPHPLTNALGVLAAALHPHSEGVLLLAGYAAVGALVAGVFVVGWRLFGAAAGALAALLVFSRDTLLFYGALAYVDVLFAALVVWAVALEAARPKRGAPVLVLLALAGLARPEAWLLSAAYWLYARPPDRGRALRWAALAASAPALWAVIDLLVTGDPLFSFTSTRADTPASGRPTGVSGLLSEGPRIVARTARPDVCLAAIAGLVVAHRLGRLWLLAGALVASGAATALLVVAGLPLNDRYVLVPMALLCVAAAAPLALLLRAGEPTAWRALGGACMLLLFGGAVVQGPRLLDRRDDVVDRTERRAAARDALRPGVPCLPLVVPNLRLRAPAASWLDVDVDEVRDGLDGIPPGAYLWGTEAAMRNLVVVAGRASAVAHAPSAPVVRRSDGWTLSASCPA